VTQSRTKFTGDWNFLYIKNSITREERLHRFPTDKRIQQPLSGQYVAHQPKFFSHCCHRNPSILSPIFEYL